MFEYIFKFLNPLLMVALLAFGFVFYPAPGWSGSDLRPLKSDFWEGAVRGDASGNAVSCFLHASKSNGEFDILLLMNRSGFHITLYNKGWTLTAGEKFQARVHIDRRYAGFVPAETTSDVSVDYKFGDTQKAIQALKAGNKIILDSPLGQKWFKLIGTRKAINVLEQCAATYLAAGEDAAPQTDTNALDAAIEAFKNKEYESAYRQLLPLAENGDATAQNLLGVLYYGGNGVAKNFAQAIRWFRRAADQGNGWGLNNLGEMYRDGEGVPVDLKLAKRWFRKAAKQGNEKARKNLDAMASSGPTASAAPQTATDDPADQVQQEDPDAMIAHVLTLLEVDPGPADPVAARKLAMAAVAMGDRRALLLMSLMFEKGIGGPADAEKAMDYLNQAADALLPDALYRRAKLTAKTDPDSALRDIRLAAAEGFIPALQVYATLEYWESNGPDSAPPMPAPAIALPVAAQPVALPIAKGELIAIQAMLNSLGYSADAPLGNMTGKTTAAITAFQEHENLPVDGIPSIDLRDQLVNVLGRGN